MATNDRKQTSPDIASHASELLSNPTTPSKVKGVAASALAQARRAKPPAKPAARGRGGKR